MAQASIPIDASRFSGALSDAPPPSPDVSTTNLAPRLSGIYAPPPDVDRRLTDSDLAGGIVADVGGNGCFIVCFLVGDIQVGVYFTPPTPNDVYFGDVHIFGSIGGGFLGITAAPDNPPDFAFGNKIPGSTCCQWSLGFSAAAGGSIQFFQTEANTPDAFSGYARNVSWGLGPLSGGLAQNSSGQQTFAIGVGISHSWIVGANIYNSYTWISPGLWPK